MIDRDFVDAIQESVKTETVTIDGKEYASAEVFNPPLPKEPAAETLSVETLTGLVDYCKTTLDGLDKSKLLLQVISYHEAALLSNIRGENRKREQYVSANCKGYSFQFGKFMPHSEFMIGLQSLFSDYGDRGKVLRVVGTIKDETAKTSIDDGITQKVTASAGITLQQEVALPNPVILKPFRTFLEIEQPPSMFVLRVQSKNGGLPDVALFEADGGQWKREAILSVREYLAKNIDGIAVIA